MRRLVLFCILICSSCGSESPSSPGPAPVQPDRPDSVEGLWYYQGFTTPESSEEKALSGLFLFHEGRFLHQAMRVGEPQELQLVDTHSGTYRSRPSGVTLDVELGVVVTPAQETLLSSRSNTSHDIGTEISGDGLRLTFGNGTVETLTRIETAGTSLFALDTGYLGITDKHFILVTNPGTGWLAGSGTYERQEEAVRFHCFSWVTVQDGKASYARDQLFEATFDGARLAFGSGHTFQLK